MRTPLVRAGILTIVCAFATVACGAQLDGGTRHSFFVRSVQAPTANPNGTCTYSADTTAPVLFEGQLDVSLTDSYKLTMLLQAGDGSEATSVTGAHVVLKRDDVVLSESDVILNSFVPKAGFGIAYLTAIDAPAKEKLLNDLPNRSANVSLVSEIVLTGGDPAGGVAASSPLFRFPVKACNGCLVDFSTGADTSSARQPNCDKAITPMDTGRKPCAFGQDAVVPCQLCVNVFKACDPLTP